MLREVRHTILINTFLSILLLFVVSNSGYAYEARWEPVPLTTIQQNKTGVAGGEGFQKVMCIVYAPSDPDIIYFGTDTAQVWKSVDGGDNWFPSGNGFSANGARSLFVSPKNPDLVIAAGFLGKERERVGKNISPLQGIFRSVDGANSWSLIHKAEFYKQDSTGSLFVSDSRTVNDKDTKIYVGTYDQGLLSSDDNGRYWKAAGFNSGHIIDIEELPAEPGTLIIVTDTGLYRYRDGDVKKIGDGLSEAPLSIAVSQDAPKFVYAVTPNDGVFHSADMGVSFVKVSSGLPAVGAYYSDLAMAPADSDIMYLGTHKGYRKGPYYSNSGGKIWKHSASINAKGLIDSRGFYFSSPFSPHPAEPLEALSASNGKARILRTVDGGKTWFYSGSGYTGARITDVVFLKNGEMILSLTDHGLWKSSNNGAVFHPLSVSSGFGKSSGALAISKNTIVASIGGWKKKVLAVSHNGGNEWELQNYVKSSLNYITYHPQNNKIIYAGSYRSDDNSQSWKRLQYEIVAMSPINGDTIYGLNKKQNHLYKSDDRGNTWRIIPNMPDKLRIYDVVVDYINDKKIYVASSKGVYIFNGKNWIQRGQENGLLKDSHGFNHIKTIAIDPTDSNVLYVGKWAPGKGVSNGVFKSVDRGITWKSINHNLGNNLNIWDITVNPFNGIVYAATTYGLQKLLARDIKNDK